MTKIISLFVVIFAVVLALPPSLVDAKCNEHFTAIMDTVYSIIRTPGASVGTLRSALFSPIAQALSKSPSAPTFDAIVESVDLNKSAETLADDLQIKELQWLKKSNDDKEKFKLVALSSGVYFFNKVLKTYDEAEETCKSFGLKLAHIEAEEDVLKVAAAAPSRGIYWISGIKNHQNCKMINCKREREDSSSKYFPCNSTYNFICQVPSKCK